MVPCWQGEYEKAEEMYRKALAIDIKVYGENHTEVATDLNNLADLLQTNVSVKRESS